MSLGTENLFRPKINTMTYKGIIWNCFLRYPNKCSRWHGRAVTICEKAAGTKRVFTLLRKLTPMGKVTSNGCWESSTSSDCGKQQANVKTLEIKTGKKTLCLFLKYLGSVFFKHCTQLQFMGALQYTHHHRQPNLQVWELRSLSLYLFVSVRGKGKFTDPTAKSPLTVTCTGISKPPLPIHAFHQVKHLCKYCKCTEEPPSSWQCWKIILLRHNDKL